MFTGKDVSVCLGDGGGGSVASENGATLFGFHELVSPVGTRRVWTEVVVLTCKEWRKLEGTHEL